MYCGEDAASVIHSPSVRLSGQKHRTAQYFASRVPALETRNEKSLLDDQYQVRRSNRISGFLVAWSVSGGWYHRRVNSLAPLPETPLGRYRHYKGGEYEVLGIVRHSPA